MDSPINILIVMHGAGLGGVETALKTLCKYIDKKQFRIIAALPSDGPLKSALDEIGITTIITPIELWTPIKFHFGERHYFQFLSGLKERIGALVKIIEEEGIDIVHSATLSVADGAFAAKVAGRPHIWHIHGKFLGTGNEAVSFGTYLPIDTIYALLNSLSTRIIAVSEDVRKFLQGFLPEVQVQVIYNGIEFQEFIAGVGPALTIRDEYHLHGKHLVVLVGRIANVKGIEDFIGAAEKVLAMRNDTVFIIVGPEENKSLSEKMKNRVAAANLSDRIIFAGYRTDIFSILRESDVFVCSSKAEGFSYACLEAMAAAKPVVTTKCGGPEELVIHGETGFHVNIGRPEELAHALHQLLDDRQLREAMGRRGGEVMEQKFSAEIYARGFETVYKSINADNLRQTSNPWGLTLIKLISDMGDLGARTRKLEQEVRDLRSFEALFKDNVLYRGFKKWLKS